MDYYKQIQQRFKNEIFESLKEIEKRITSKSRLKKIQYIYDHKDLFDVRIEKNNIELITFLVKRLGFEKVFEKFESHKIRFNTYSKALEFYNDLSSGITGYEIDALHILRSLLMKNYTDTEKEIERIYRETEIETIQSLISKSNDARDIRLLNKALDRIDKHTRVYISPKNLIKLTKSFKNDTLEEFKTKYMIKENPKENDYIEFYTEFKYLLSYHLN